MKSNTQNRKAIAWIALRFLRGGQRSAFSATFVSILGLVIGVAALTVTLAILTGFDREYKKSILGLSAHAVILSANQTMAADQRTMIENIKSYSFIRGVSPFIMHEGMLANSGRVSGVLVKGILPSSKEDISGLSSMLLPVGTLEEALVSHEGEVAGTIIGDEVARKLGINRGDVVQLLILSERGLPRAYPLRVRAFFHSGLYEYDSRFIFVSLTAGQQMFVMPGEITGYELVVDRPERIEQFTPIFRNEISSPMYLLQWKELNQNLFAALKLEKIVFFLLIVPLVMVGALTVVAALIMFMMERERGIAILRALGFTRRRIAQMFLFQGVLIATLGIGGGLFIGLMINIFLQKFPLIRLSPQIYFIDHVPIEMSSLDLGLVIITSLVLCLLATLIPAYKASRLEPSEVIRGSS